jgi:hypothetical protein
MSPRLCPNCKTTLEPFAEVDIGVGTLQGGPWGCPACHWVESQECPVCGHDPCRCELEEPDSFRTLGLRESDFL